MFGLGSHAENSSNHQDENQSRSEAYLAQANRAQETGDTSLAAHLYLAAFEAAQESHSDVAPDYVEGLRRAWRGACDAKERSLAEYIFGKLEPNLSPDESKQCARQLQRMALERLEEFGFSPEAVEDIADMIAEDFAGADSIMQLGGSSLAMGFLPQVSQSLSAQASQPLPIRSSQKPRDLTRADGSVSDATIEDDLADENALASFRSMVTSRMNDESTRSSGQQVDNFNTQDSSDRASDHIAEELRPDRKEGNDSEGISQQPTKEGSDQLLESSSFEEPLLSSEDHPSNRMAVVGHSSIQKEEPPHQQSSSESNKEHLFEFPKPGKAEVSQPDMQESDLQRITFADLIGYDGAIEAARARGIGVEGDEEFSQLLSMLGVQHGLPSMPRNETILIRAASREDANQFMLAVAGELEGPMIRMFMDVNPQGAPILCIMASPEFRIRFNAMRAHFDGPATIMLENIDEWGVPTFVSEHDFDPSAAQLTRGAREAVNFIRQAVLNPQIAVLASATDEGPLDGFFADILDPLDEILIDVPSRNERAAIWKHVCVLHPSLADLDCDEIIDLSEELTRFELYSAARLAAEEAYKQSVRAREYKPVSRSNMLDKLAHFQLIDSEQYKRLEDALVADLAQDLEYFDDLLQEGEENHGNHETL